MSMEFAQVHLLALVVCADKTHTDKEVLEFAEAHHPAGTTMGWMIRKPEEVTGGKNPCQCDGDENKQHWVLVV